MLVISIPSDDLLLHQRILENINGRAIFVIVVIERWTSLSHLWPAKCSGLEYLLKLADLDLDIND